MKKNGQQFQWKISCLLLQFANNPKKEWRVIRNSARKYTLCALVDLLLLLLHCAHRLYLICYQHLWKHFNFYLRADSLWMHYWLCVLVVSVDSIAARCIQYNNTIFTR